MSVNELSGTMKFPFTRVNLRKFDWIINFDGSCDHPLPEVTKSYLKILNYYGWQQANKLLCVIWTLYYKRKIVLILSWELSQILRTTVSSTPRLTHILSNWWMSEFYYKSDYLTFFKQSQEHWLFVWRRTNIIKVSSTDNYQFLLEDANLKCVSSIKTIPFINSTK